MTIDLSDPFTGTIAGGIVLMIISGTYHYIVTLLRLHETDKKLNNVISELDTLYKDHKKEIAEIKKKQDYELTKAVQRALDIYDKKMSDLIDHNRPHAKSLNALANMPNLPKGNALSK